MALHVFRISAYDHVAETLQFDAIRTFLLEKYETSEEECVLIGNYNIEGVELDALLITTEGVRILEFKNWGGNIIARENGSWKADGMVIEGGAGGKSPFFQIRQNKSRLALGMKKICGMEAHVFSASIIFWKDCCIDCSQLSETVRIWLHVCDNSHIEGILEGMNRKCLTNQMVREMPRRLQIEEFAINCEPPLANITNEQYEPEASANLYEDLAAVLKCMPDYQKIYNMLSRVFQKCLEQNTANTRLNLGGTFAKTDYLLKEFHAPSDLVKKVNDTRVRLRKRIGAKQEDLQKWCLHDLRNICQFVAFLYKTDIPATLQEAFPTEHEGTYQRQLLGECLRMIVEVWDDDFVYGPGEDSADDEKLKICYSHGNKFYNYDWTYLRGMFYRGAQLNLIRPRENEGVIYPELIIFEPDYLVDISTVAKCFTNYAESPFVNLINKIQPSQSTEAIMLGNFAGQLLDEQIHKLPHTYSYKDSVTEFWKNNAISLLTVGIGHEFHSEAQKQRENIAYAMGTVLPGGVAEFNPQEGMVEPSFFSEMLGLQGRMDYLQLDFKVLLEQKSGKGDYPYDNFKIPKFKEEHYVQMLLYMTLIRYNYREIFEQNNQELRAFLLYSKYKESLLGLGFAPELIFRALKVRNGLAWTEMLYTQEDGIRILDTLTPEKLNMKKVDNNLWQKHQRDQIAQVLAPIQQASELEKAYYYRFLTFIENEHMLSKLGNKTKENSGFASKWHDTLEEKLQAGNIYDKLGLISPNEYVEGNIKRVKLRFMELRNSDMSNFRIGDIVILYAYDPKYEPDARKAMVFRGTIENIEPETIDVVLRAAQTDARVFLREKHKMWAIEHDFMESSYSSLYRGMHAFLSAPQDRKDLLLLQRTPEIDESRQINGEYGDFNELSARVKRAKDIFLIIGPPGTGKTSFGMLNTLKEELTEPQGTVLLLSYTNRAVDEICSKLYQEKIDFIRLGGDISCSQEYHDKLLINKAQQCQNIDELKQLIHDCRVVVATTTSMNSNIALFQMKQFSLAIIDEASQILEPHLIGILSAHNNSRMAVQKMVLIGDHKQLPAVVQQKEDLSRVNSIELNKIHLKDCRLSFFERMLNAFRLPNGRYDERFVYMLTRQGRMHHDIALFPNYAFYSNQLMVVPRPHQQVVLPTEGLGQNGIDDLLLTRRIVFLHVDAPKESLSDKMNQNEADMIAATVLRIHEREKENFETEETVGVIVPYRNQIATVRNAIDRSGIKALHNITIDTVERYQGSQRKYIVYGFTIQKYYQLNFLTNNVFTDEWDGNVIDRKLNVAMTRAEEHLIMVGNAGLLANNFTFYKLMEFVRSKHGYFNIPKEKYVKGEFKVPQYDRQEIDLSQATYSTTTLFDNAFHTLVMEPIKATSGEEWPTKVFGHDMGTNLNAIGYGRINISNQLQMFDDFDLSPQRQVQIYCYYMMRQHYCSSRNLYLCCHEWLKTSIEAFHGRVQMIDIGCGPATCGISFREVYGAEAPNMVYTGIDISTEMKQMGRRMMEQMFSSNVHIQMKESLNELEDGFWDGCSELPSLVVFNLSYFFSNISAVTAEQMARQILGVMQRYTLNRYVLFIQHAETDRSLNSYKAFRNIISPHMQTIKDEKAEFSYILNNNEYSQPFCYTVQTK